MTTDDGLPPIDRVTAPWWDATRDRRLLLQRCERCGHVQHYPRLLCTACGAVEAYGWIEASGRGSVDTYTVVHRASAPGVEVPYTVARVRLAEGPVLLTRLTGVPDDASAFGAAVALDWQPLPDGRHLPTFTARAAAPARPPGG